MSFPNPRLTAAVLITTAWLSLSRNVQGASIDSVLAEPPSPAGLSSKSGVRRRPAGEFIPGCDDEAKKVIERALAAYRSLQTYQDRRIRGSGRTEAA